MRKKLEKGAIKQLQSRIAQQNRAAGSAKPVVEINNDNDSDMDPNEGKDEPLGNQGGATNANQIQLNPAQVEEAKQMTYGRMKQFRQDRTHNSDRERLQFLTDYLKKSRVIDD